MKTTCIGERKGNKEIVSISRGFVDISRVWERRGNVVRSASRGIVTIDELGKKCGGKRRNIVEGVREKVVAFSIETPRPTFHLFLIRAMNFNEIRANANLLSVARLLAAAYKGL